MPWRHPGHVYNQSSRNACGGALPTGLLLTPLPCTFLTTRRVYNNG